MPLHEFSLVVSAADPHDPDLDVRVHEAGCDDATLVLQGGVLRLDFAREAPDRDEAVRTASSDASRAGLVVVRVDVAEGAI